MKKQSLSTLTHPVFIENLVTYPLSTAMLGLPKAKVVRGFSFFGASFVYVIFEDNTDIYWARSRVLEYLSQVQGRLPANARAALGPDATGVGWIYEYALVDRTALRHDGRKSTAREDRLQGCQQLGLPARAQTVVLQLGK